jgi:hypothetical protein
MRGLFLVKGIKNHVTLAMIDASHSNNGNPLSPKKEGENMDQGIKDSAG